MSVLLSSPPIYLATATPASPMLPPPLMKRLGKTKAGHGCATPWTANTSEVNGKPPITAHGVANHAVNTKHRHDHQRAIQNYGQCGRHNVRSPPNDQAQPQPLSLTLQCKSGNRISYRCRKR